MRFGIFAIIALVSAGPPRPTPTPGARMSDEDMIEQEVYNIFHMLDANNDGKITWYEVRDAMDAGLKKDNQKLRKYMKKMFRQADVNNDKMVDRMELENAIKAQVEERM